MDESQINEAAKLVFRFHTLLKVGVVFAKLV